MKTIYKYEIKEQNFGLIGCYGEFEIEMPKSADILSVITQLGKGVIYAKVETDNIKEKRYFYCVGTGQEFDSNIKVKDFVGTYITGNYVWHLFEILKGVN